MIRSLLCAQAELSRKPVRKISGTSDVLTSEHEQAQRLFANWQVRAQAEAGIGIDSKLSGLCGALMGVHDQT